MQYKKSSSVVEYDLVHAYLRHNENTNYKKISVKKLTETAGYDRTTFYIHYNGIDEFITTLENIALANTEILYGSLLTMHVEERRQQLKEHLDIYSSYHWPLYSKNGRPEYKKRFRECIKRALGLHMRDTLFGNTFTTNFIADFMINGMIDIVVGYFSGEKEPYIPKSTEDLAQIIDRMIFAVDRKFIEKYFMDGYEDS